jgi:peptide/nickel transport system substrate-binding protein
VGNQPADTGRSPGELVVSIRTEPRSFNRLVARDTSTDLVALLTHAKLVRINRVTDEVEPWLAESWTRSDDGLRYAVKLRSNVAFSDGHPFSAADVVFSAAAAYSIPAAADTLTVGGKKLGFSSPDPLTVVVTFPSRFAPGVRILDNLWLLPRHKLGSALEGGTLAEAWSTSTPASEMAGLGPFVLAEHAPGQRLVLARNAKYWRTDGEGRQLPRLDRVVLEIVPEEDAELLRLRAGETDMTASEMTPEAYAAIRRDGNAGGLQLFDLGVGYDADTLWFNLKPGAFAGDPRAPWLQRDELRRAISMAVDRQSFADTVFFGAAVPIYGPITPANRKWYDAGVPRPPHDPAAARELLSSIGLADRDGDGMLEDRQSRPARFTIVTQKGRRSQERGVAVIRDELKRVGLGVDVAMLDAAAVIERIVSGRYEAVYFRPLMSDTDPASNMDFWLSSGSGHYWNMGQQTPATAWERRVDELMLQQMRIADEGERKRVFGQVQALFAEHEPALFFAAQRVFAASSARVINIEPSVLRPQLFWAPDSVAVRE